MKQHVFFFEVLLGNFLKVRLIRTFLKIYSIYIRDEAYVQKCCVILWMMNLLNNNVDDNSEIVVYNFVQKLFIRLIISNIAKIMSVKLSIYMYKNGICPTDQ
jgi:hypothetical protein